VTDVDDTTTLPTLSVGLGASRRHLALRTGQVCILVRHTSSLVVAAVSVVDRDLTAGSAGRLLLAALGVWALYRLATRSPLWQFTAADFGWILAVGCNADLIVHGAASFDSGNAAQVVVTVAVATFALQLPMVAAVPAALGIMASYAWGSAQIVGWSNVFRVPDVYYLLVSSVVASVIRLMILRVADAVDRTRGERQAAEVVRNVSAARRDYDREQLALLHDTAAATLLMVGQDAEIASARLAAQARRDLDVLEHGPRGTSAVRIDVVAGLRTETAHLPTAVQFTGEDVLWLRGDLGDAVLSATREVLNNVDRHARASMISIEVQPNRVVITDDGVGFTPDGAPAGHGIGASIIARMNRVGGGGSVDSTPARGTVAELSWPDAQDISASVDSATEADRLIGRIRGAYTLAMSGLAVATLASAVPPITAYSQHGAVQVGLAAVTGLCALAAVPAVLYAEHRPAWAGAVLLAVIAVVQPALLSTSELTGDANWGLAGVGFCLVPLLLRWPTSRGAATLLTYWAVPAIITLIRAPSEQTGVFLGLSLAGALVPQLFATLFSTWAFQAAQAARAEHDNLVEVVTAERIAGAIQADYVKRYADVMAAVMPLLRALSHGGPVTAEVRRQARAESRRLRTLFDQLRADHPLLFELRAVIEAAEDRGVEVATHFDGRLPQLAQHDVDRLVRVVGHALALASSSARMVVTATEGEIVVSVVCEVAPQHAGRPTDFDDVDLVWSGRTAWFTVRQEVDSPEVADRRSNR
jgi:hypothetical protein